MRPRILAALLAFFLVGLVSARTPPAAEVVLRIPYVLKVELLPGYSYFPGDPFPFDGALTIRVVCNGRFLLRISILPGEEGVLDGKRLGPGEHLFYGRGRTELRLQGKGVLVVEPGG